MDVEKLIDLNNYPIHQPDSAQYLKVVKDVQLGLDQDGCSVLSNFLARRALTQLPKRLN